MTKNHPLSPTIQTNIHEFTLIPNIKKVGAQRVLRFFSWVFIPLFLTHVLFVEIFGLESGEYVLAQLPVLVILLNLYYFIIQRMKLPQSLQLCVEMDELCLKAGDQLLHSQKLADLTVQQLGWGMETENLLPALRIQGLDFPKLIIGTRQSTPPWTNIQQSIEFTDYWLYPNDSWEKLKSLLQA